MLWTLPPNSIDIIIPNALSPITDTKPYPVTFSWQSNATTRKIAHVNVIGITVSFDIFHGCFTSHSRRTIVRERVFTVTETQTKRPWKDLLQWSELNECFGFDVVLNSFSVPVMYMWCEYVLQNGFPPSINLVLFHRNYLPKAGKMQNPNHHIGTG